MRNEKWEKRNVRQFKFFLIHIKKKNVSLTLLQDWHDNCLAENGTISTAHQPFCRDIRHANPLQRSCRRHRSAHGRNRLHLELYRWRLKEHGRWQTARILICDLMRNICIFYTLLLLIGEKHIITEDFRAFWDESWQLFRKFAAITL